LFDWQKEMKRLIAAREFIEFFRLAVQHKLNIIIFGGTGSGKTPGRIALRQQRPEGRAVRRVILPDAPSYLVWQ
ncbi:P-type DNA transfer ATPase VirB11, partial [Salmonella enterica subsp. enterica serovar Anatum]|nr:P-type DNA transfer ATPase VirB11 [Salmonella enterica subsp. enterica serovar Anatum]